MAQDKEEKKTEDETYKAEAVHRLELPRLTKSGSGKKSRP